MTIIPYPRYHQTATTSCFRYPHFIHTSKHLYRRFGTLYYTSVRAFFFSLVFLAFRFWFFFTLGLFGLGTRVT